MHFTQLFLCCQRPLQKVIIPAEQPGRVMSELLEIDGPRQTPPYYLHVSSDFSFSSSLFLMNLNG